MPQTTENPPPPAESGPQPRRRAGPSPRQQPRGDDQTRLAQDAAVDRKVLQHLVADHDAQSRQVAELEAQLERLKQQGTQLVKQLQVARKATAAQSQTIALLRERIAKSEQLPPGGKADADRPAKPAIVGGPVGHAAQNRPPALPGAAETSRRTAPPVDSPACSSATAEREPSGEQPAAGRPPATTDAVAPPTPDAVSSSAGVAGRRVVNAARPDSATASGDYIDDNPLVGQLLAYQARQTEAGRRRRLMLSLSLFLAIPAVLLGLWLLALQIAHKVS